MNITHYLPNDVLPVKGYGGINRMAQYLGKAQAEMGHHVTFICKSGSHLPFAKTLEAPPYAIKDLTPFIPSGTDVVQLYSQPQFKLGIPFVVNDGCNGRPGQVYHHNTVFVSQNNAQRHNWTEFCYNGIDPADYPLQHTKQNALLFLGKADWIVKNLPGAALMAKQAGYPLHVGGGHAPFWFKNTVSYGTVDGAQKIALLQSARALLFPMIWEEPFGLVSIEALACGTPVFSFHRGALPEIVTEACGYLATSHNDMVSALKSMKPFDPEVCRQRVLDHFTHIHMANQYERYYHKVIRTGKIREQDGYPVAMGKPQAIKLYPQSRMDWAKNMGTALYIKASRYF
jgi:hypothetical protein